MPWPSATLKHCLYWMSRTNVTLKFRQFSRRPLGENVSLLLSRLYGESTLFSEHKCPMFASFLQERWQVVLLPHVESIVWSEVDIQSPLVTLSLCHLITNTRVMQSLQKCIVFMGPIILMKYFFGHATLTVWNPKDRWCITLRKKLLWRSKAKMKFVRIQIFDHDINSDRPWRVKLTKKQWLIISQNKVGNLWGCENEPN